MPYQSRAAVAARARRLLTERYLDLCLVVQDHTGAEVIRVGGCWDRIGRRYVDRPCVARVFSLQESQYEVGHCVARYVRARLANDPDRISLLMAIGNRGSGKTFAGALLIVLLALAIPGSWQAAVNITAKQKRDVMGAIKKIVGAKSDPISGKIVITASSWLAADNADFRDPSTVFRSGSTLLWGSSKNPDALRTAELNFENILINEGQSQPVEVYTNAAGAIRNTGGIVSIATNPPQRTRGDWVAKVYRAIQGQPDDAPRKGEAFILVNTKNAAIDQATVPKIHWMLMAADRRAAEADAEGIIKLSGELGYPDFVSLPAHKGGHLLDELALKRLTSAWTDVTREETERVCGAAFDNVAGTDFQKRPGSCAAVGKLYRDEQRSERYPRGKLILVIREFVVTEGTNTDLSQALVSRGYFPGRVDLQGRQAPGRSLLLVGDATGKHQGPAHEAGELYSFVELRAQGWTVIPPDHHWKTGVPRNPFVEESQRQMQSIFRDQAILLGPECDKQAPGFPSLVEGFENTKITPAGKFVKRDHFTHGPDCCRYLCWCFLDRPQAPEVDQSIDAATFSLLVSLKPSSR